MWVDAKVFMQLVETVTTLKLKCAKLEERVETLEKRPVIIQATGEEKKDESNLSLQQYQELMDGVADVNTGRVRYTDGRE
jgi:hypothetical protein